MEGNGMTEARAGWSGASGAAPSSTRSFDICPFYQRIEAKRRGGARPERGGGRRAGALDPPAGRTGLRLGVDAVRGGGAVRDRLRIGDRGRGGRGAVRGDGGAVI